MRSRSLVQDLTAVGSQQPNPMILPGSPTAPPPAPCTRTPPVQTLREASRSRPRAPPPVATYRVASYRTVSHRVSSRGGGGTNRLARIMGTFAREAVDTLCDVSSKVTTATFSLPKRHWGEGLGRHSWWRKGNHKHHPVGTRLSNARNARPVCERPSTIDPRRANSTAHSRASTSKAYLTPTRPPHGNTHFVHEQHHAYYIPWSSTHASPRMAGSSDHAQRDEKKSGIGKHVALLALRTCMIWSKRLGRRDKRHTPRSPRIKHAHAPPPPCLLVSPSTPIPLFHLHLVENLSVSDVPRHEWVRSVRLFESLAGHFLPGAVLLQHGPRHELDCRQRPGHLAPAVVREPLFFGSFFVYSWKRGWGHVRAFGRFQVSVLLSTRL